MYRITFSLLLLVCLNWSCTKETSEPSATRSLIFGDFYGFCPTDCVHIYKLTTDSLLQDQNETYPRRDVFYDAKFLPRPQADFVKVRAILDQVPAALLQNTNMVIGQPDASDGGGYYLEYKDADTHQFWIVDKFRTNVPSALHPFLDEVDVQLDYLR
jgi:hypothetical protein